MWELIVQASERSTDLIDPAELPGAQISLDALFSNGINLFLSLITLGAFLSLLYSGFLYITSAGDPNKAETARKNILWSIIGILIALLSFVLLSTVANWHDLTRSNNKYIAVFNNQPCQSINNYNFNSVSLIENKTLIASQNQIRYTDPGLLPENFAGFRILPPCLRTADAARTAGFECILEAIRYYTTILLVFTAIGAFVYLLYGAFLYSTAFGNEQKIAQAKKTISYSLIGVFLVTLAIVIIETIRRFFNVS